METVKEKLAKLIGDITKEEHILLHCIKYDAGEDVGFCCENCRFSNNGCADAVIVDRLIQNGVTIQEWVSVDERLPKEGEYVLFLYAKNNRNPVQFAKNTMAVGRYEHKRFLVDGCEVKVTSWMPLPNDPESTKGEDNND